jgi:O-antigen/teichoic acid export membrane protein
MAATMATAAMNLASAVSWVLFPVLNRRYGESASGASLGRLVVTPTVILAHGLPVLLAGLMYAALVLLQYFLPAYLGAYGVYLALMPAVVGFGLAAAPASALLAIDRHRAIISLQMGVVALNVVGCVALALGGGPLEAVAAWTSLCYLVYGVGAVRMAVRHVQPDTSAGMLVARLLLPALWMAGVVVTVELVWPTGTLTDRGLAPLLGLATKLAVIGVLALPVVALFVAETRRLDISLLRRRAVVADS